ncbi:hypothetical protein GQ42DRAFT_153757 [Ramicandelaber brevisporus]|nr:hypothetical protein GQ42DRAFT_153757 [Ramicandelaber brevisporus]
MRPASAAVAICILALALAISAQDTSSATTTAANKTTAAVDIDSIWSVTLSTIKTYSAAAFYYVGMAIVGVIWHVAIVPVLYLLQIIGFIFIGIPYGVVSSLWGALSGIVVFLFFSAILGTVIGGSAGWLAQMSIIYLDELDLASGIVGQLEGAENAVRDGVARRVDSLRSTVEAYSPFQLIRRSRSS